LAKTDRTGSIDRVEGSGRRRFPGARDAGLNSFLQQWPPNSPDLNLVEYSIRSVLQEKVYHSRITSLEELKTRLINDWAQLDQSITDATACACVSARGAQFGHKS